VKIFRCDARDQFVQACWRRFQQNFPCFGSKLKFLSRFADQLLLGLQQGGAARRYSPFLNFNKHGDLFEKCIYIVVTCLAELQVEIAARK
jgi:hypothetical protein